MAWHAYCDGGESDLPVSWKQQDVGLVFKSFLSLIHVFLPQKSKYYISYMFFIYVFDFCVCFHSSPPSTAEASMPWQLSERLAKARKGMNEKLIAVWTSQYTEV